MKNRIPFAIGISIIILILLFIPTGQQVCTVRFLSGQFRGRTAEGWNMLGDSLS